jgi:hypothetical protein
VQGEISSFFFTFFLGVLFWLWFGFTLVFSFAKKWFLVLFGFWYITNFASIHGGRHHGMSVFLFLDTSGT